MKQSLRLAHLYPEQMSIYGDRGNVIALRQRCAWRGIELDVVPIGVGESIDWPSFDMAFFGGGQDSGQALIAEDLRVRHAGGLRAAVEDGLTMLAICGGYQLLGHYFLTHQGERLPGLGIMDVHTLGSAQRLIGNIVVEADLDAGRWTADGGTADGGTASTVQRPLYNFRLVGFENHSGRTYHGAGVRSLGRVLVGHGDNGEDGWGGATYRNLIGCYLHGSLLPKNPQLTDRLIELAMRRHYGAHTVLAPLEAALELRAQQAMTSKLLTGSSL